MISALQLAAITWNVGQKESHDMFPALKSFIPNEVDVVAIALEEISSHDGIVNGRALNAMNNWIDGLDNELKDNFHRAFSENLGSVACFIYFNKSSKYTLKIIGQVLLSLKDDVVTDRKSSISGIISISNGNITKRISVIGNHLQCYDEEYSRRNKEWNMVINEQIETDYIVFMGDLNYRIELPHDKVMGLIKDSNIKELLKYDQLNKAKKENKQFNKYDEAEITFNPTYKFDENSDNYDSSKLQRIPSYTDRILVSTETTSQKPVFKCYHSLVDVKLSDHRPVYAIIEFKL